MTFELKTPTTSADVLPQESEGRPNRIAIALEKKRLGIMGRVNDGLVTVEQLATVSSQLDMDLIEFCKFQELKSLACIHGLLTLDEAQLVYELLGEVPDTFNAQPVHVKAVLTGLFKELLEKRINGKL